MRLPDFICAGAQKSGTTWLYKQLAGHPQVFIPTKELNYFCGANDLAWYGGQFEKASAAQRCGDISPRYAAFPEVAARIHAACPDAVILHLLRDPVSRAHSQWKMLRHVGKIPQDLSFIAAFHADRESMRRRGEYSNILNEYARFYDLQRRCRVFWYDDIRDRPADLLKQVMGFIGVDPDWRSPHLQEVVHATREPIAIDAEDALEVRRYYEPHDHELRVLLGVRRLPWDGR